jgi:hypothetical protein
MLLHDVVTGFPGETTCSAALELRYDDKSRTGSAYVIF